MTCLNVRTWLSLSVWPPAAAPYQKVGVLVRANHAATVIPKRRQWPLPAPPVAEGSPGLLNAEAEDGAGANDAASRMSAQTAVPARIRTPSFAYTGPLSGRSLAATCRMRRK